MPLYVFATVKRLSSRKILVKFTRQCVLLCKGCLMDLAKRNHWGKDARTDYVVSYLRGFSDAGAAFAVVVADEEHIGLIRKLSLGRYGVVVFYGEYGGGEASFVVLIASLPDLGDFENHLADLMARYGASVAFVQAYRVAFMTPFGDLRSFDWDGTLEGIASVYGELAGRNPFTILGLYDTSNDRRHAESLKPVGGRKDE